MLVARDEVNISLGKAANQRNDAEKEEGEEEKEEDEEEEESSASKTILTTNGSKTVNQSLSR